MPSSLILPVVPGVSVPTGLPPCPGLRGEPCRDYQPYVNQPDDSLTARAQAAPRSFKMETARQVSMELRGLEPLTFALPARRSPS